MFLVANGDSTLVNYNVYISLVLRASVNLLTIFSHSLASIYSADLLVFILCKSVYILKFVVLPESF